MAASDEKEMVDKGGVCYAIFFMLGVGSLLPWNVFINAYAYFHLRFTGTPFAFNFENFFGICFNVSNVISLTLVTKYVSMFSMRSRVVYSLILQGVLFSLTTALVLIPPESIDGHTVFAITIPTCLIAGLLTAVLQGGVFGLAGMFPGAYMQALMAGQGLGGMGVSIAALVTTAASPPTVGDPTYTDVRWSTFVYFLVASVFSFVCVMGYLSLLKLPFALHYAGSMLLPNSSKYRDNDGLLEDPLLNKNEEDNDQDLDDDGNDGGSARDNGEILKEIAWYAFTVFNVFWVTLAVFPSVTSAIKPQSGPKESQSTSRFLNDLWSPIFFLCFNGLDFVGRSLAGPAPNLLPGGPKMLGYYSIARWVFVPLFMLCNIGDDDNKSMLPVLFKSYAWPLIFMFAFALSNGYISSRAMMHAPSIVRTSEQEVAGMLMALLLVLGLAAGSVSSFLLHYITCTCNPFAG